ncbi:hypothetical protein [uncultured Maricaulis sp.]|uniref:hypothetical protein n=1 Tax=uncultured Maricaulis sp. TaxID=174710 RepID=UPI0030DAA987|tara:strand:- start:143892 stop:144629 length:738 start_codon:yes stop_codon:yes gene_type:complete
MSEIFTPYRPLLDLIGRSEGTDRRQGYNETLGYGRFTGGDRHLCGMTLDEVDRLQTAMLGHPDNKWQSSALGRYQIVRTTLRKLRSDQSLNGSDLFDAFMQDRLAVQLLIGRGFDRFMTGRLTEDGFINALAREWASLPTTAGTGHYGGQSAHVSLDDVRDALASCRSLAGGAEEAMSEPSPVREASVAVRAALAVSGTGIAVAGLALPADQGDAVAGYRLFIGVVLVGLALIGAALYFARRGRT